VPETYAGETAMNDDMPWVNLTQKEVEELRKQKYELTEYGKEQLRKLIYEQDMKKMKDAIDQKVVELMRNQQPYPDEMFEEAERREAERKALDAVEKLYKENGEALKQLAEIEKEEREKLNAGFKQDENGNWYRPTLQELTRNERIELAEKEIAYMVMGGQDGREYANSIAFILQVLDSLRDE
jgi:hypothetical protein